MDIKSQKHQMKQCSRRLLLSSPSRSSIPTLSHDTQCITRTRSISISPSTMVLTSLDLFHPREMLMKPRQNTGSLQGPSDPLSFPLSIHSCFPNPMTELSRSTREEAKQSVRSISPLVSASLHWLSFITLSSVINGKIASNPFYRKRESDGCRLMCARLPIAML